MKVSEYRALLKDLNLTNDQLEKITNAFDSLIQPVAAMDLRSRRQPEHSDIHNYMNGKTEGLNIAFRFFAGTLDGTDQLEHDEYD